MIKFQKLILSISMVIIITVAIALGNTYVIFESEAIECSLYTREPN